MKTGKLVTLVIALILSGGRLLAQGTQQLVVPLSEPGKPFTLEARLFHGNIKVSSYEGKDVMIEVQADTGRERDDEESSGMRRIGTGGGLDIKAEEDNNAVRINSGMSKKLLGIVVKIPQGATAVKLGTVEDGDIVVNNLSGEIEISNVNGAITAHGISGSVVANTVNGSIIVDFKTINPKAPMAFTNINGKVDITFPADTKADLKMKSDQGEMYSDFDIAVDKAQPKVEKSEEGRFHRIVIEDWVYGKINGGGPQMMIKTLDGNIYIRKAK